MALRWLGEHRFPAPPVLAVAEERQLGFVRRAVLVTATWPGIALDRLLPTLPELDRRRLAEAVGAFVAALHLAGFRDGNLDLRNLLAAPVDGRFAIAVVLWMVGLGALTSGIRQRRWITRCRRLGTLMDGWQQPVAA